ncbi:cell division protein ZipA C-terminal FtsZ-binding domain-containing protein [Sulfuriferula thiophila]|uniref:cell division protein ZipA C-terminal FtsZ-binding domain-containing protein n=1 Tax=Sulfuriferula thiophila TaxID=1781211 RepID=UPI000F611970|nr:cell division protein ZipA C-terminal FtsZ-binding domain-containing protein [Sulfuriferula thiophila]
MNSLQISLIVLAVVVIGAIFFYNWFQERKYRKQSIALFGQQDDVLLQPNPPVAERVDPVVSSMEVEIEHEPVAPVVAPVEVPIVAQEEPRVAVKTEEEAELPAPPVDPLLEYAITIQVVDAIPSAAFATLIDSQRDTGKPVRWWGYVDKQGSWVEISPWREQAFTDVAIVVQLADRAGPVTENQLFNLTHEAQQLASRFNGIASWHDIAPILVKAAKLDQFCVDVDVLIGLNVVSLDGATFNGAQIAELAEAAGMTLDNAGVYQRRSERGEIVYALCNHEDTPFSADQMNSVQTHGVTLLFEVPRVDNGLAAFAELAQFGQQLANALGGKLVDDNIRPLSPAGVEKIQTQLVHIYQAMEAHDIPAGGRRALRLFN